MDTQVTRGCASRPNTKLAAAIDRALVVLEREGRKAAADFLEGQGAGFAVTCRVQTEPSRRRAVDLPPSSN